MLKHPNASALATNFAGQWLNLRGLDSAAPLPLLYPDFDDPLRQAMRTRDRAAVRQHRPRGPQRHRSADADYTFVNERLARHYGIPHVYGSQFRRVTLGPGHGIAAWAARQGRISDDNVEAGADVAGDARQVDHDERARREPAGSACRRAAAAGPSHRRAQVTRANRRCARRWSSIACAPTASSVTG